MLVSFGVDYASVQIQTKWVIFVAVEMSLEFGVCSVV